MTPIAFPWLSPKVVILKISPNIFPATVQCFSVVPNVEIEMEFDSYNKPILLHLREKITFSLPRADRIVTLL